MTTKTKTRKPPIISPPETIINNVPRLFTEADFPVGTVSHQGDLMLVRIASLPGSSKPRSQRQLADGATMGSRHIVTRGDVYDCDPALTRQLIIAATKCDVDARYIGPVFVSPAKPRATDLDHPEHGTQGFPAGAVIAVVYQRNLDSEERERRTVD